MGGNVPLGCPSRSRPDPSSHTHASVRTPPSDAASRRPSGVTATSIVWLACEGTLKLEAASLGPGSIGGLYIWKAPSQVRGPTQRTDTRMIPARTMAVRLRIRKHPLCGQGRHLSESLFGHPGASVPAGGPAF